VVLPLDAAAAGPPNFERGTLYQCANGQSFKVMACAGPAAADWCDVPRSRRPPHPPRLTRPPESTVPYHLHDKVQVNAQGIGWMDGEIISIADGIETEYKVAVSGNRFLLASYHDRRFVKAAPPAP
jgi:hypothetical protein